MDRKAGIEIILLVQWQHICFIITNSRLRRTHILDAILTAFVLDSNLLDPASIIVTKT